MDGKKRIARLRNDEKWKRVGVVPHLRAKVRKVLNLIPVAVLPYRSDGVTWDNVDCCYVPRLPGIFSSAGSFINALKKRGYKMLGSGAYSTVMAKDGSDRVIKVQRGNDNWIDYIKWSAEKGYTGTLAPRVYSFKRHSNFAVAIVERMDRCTNDNKDDLSLIDRLLGPAKHGNVMAKLFLDELSPGCLPFFDGLFTDFGDHLDLYGKNIMIRKDGSLCVTDPVCGRSNLTSVKRLRTGDLSPAPIRIFFESSYRH